VALKNALVVALINCYKLSEPKGSDQQQLSDKIMSLYMYNVWAWKV